jgi:hypothetical protein
MTSFRIHNDLLRRELIIVAVLFAFGFFALPFAIYGVGQKMIGDYAPDAGAWALTESIWSDLLSLKLSAWLLVLSPYGVVQLLRLGRRIWRANDV